MNQDLASTAIDTPSAAMRLVEDGNTLQQVRTGFTTAVSVLKPRDRHVILKACEEEAAIAGEEFYYAWTVSTKTGSKQLVEGPGIGLTQAAARNWGNCGVMVRVEENPSTYIFTATFVDLETGFNLERAFRQRKSQSVGKKFDQDRQEDIVFQIGQSKATRNVIANALPNWLIKRMMDKAKENIIEKIRKKGIDQARKDVAAFFERYGVTIDRVEQKIRKKLAAWTEDDILLLNGAMRSLLEGVESAEDLFPSGKPDAPAFSLPDELIDEISGLCSCLGVTDADKAMRLGACKGDAQKAQAYRAELMTRMEEKNKTKEGEDKKS